MSKETKIAENALEIMGVLLEMIQYGDLPPLRTIYEKFEMGFLDLKDKITCLAEKFERENIETDWIEKDYGDEIGKFARRELFALYGNEQIFYTETWCSADIIYAANDLGVHLDKDEIGEVIKRVKLVFDDKSGRNEIMMDIVEDVIKERKGKENEN